MSNVLESMEVDRQAYRAEAVAKNVNSDLQVGGKERKRESWRDKYGGTEGCSDWDWPEPITSDTSLLTRP